MVQYIITPWRDHHELFKVRKAFFPVSEDDGPGEMDRGKAVALVSVWVQRGNCPHLIESTAILVSAMINDQAGNSVYAVRAAYSAAFCRFVTGLLDGYQDKRHKLSMYSIAKNIGLPATFVELRHQCTHEELPSLARLRAAAEKSLTWIWQRYWQTLEGPPSPSGPDECREFLEEYLRWRSSGNGDVAQGKEFRARLRTWDASLIMDILSEFWDSESADTSIIMHAVKLSREIIEGGLDHEAAEYSRDSEKKVRSLEEIKEEMAQAREALEVPDENIPIETGREDFAEDHEMAEDDNREKLKGWTLWEGPWIPKPIGVV